MDWYFFRSFWYEGYGKVRLEEGSSDLFVFEDSFFRYFVVVLC